MTDLFVQDEAHREKPTPQVHLNPISAFSRAPIKDGSGESALLHYMVRNGYAWANIYVRLVPMPSGRDMKNRSIELVVNSDHGVYGYYWSHPGRGDWREFVGHLEFEYAMRKLAGDRFERHVNKAEFLKAMREKVDAFAADGEEAPLGLGGSEERVRWLRDRRDSVNTMRHALYEMEHDDDVQHYGDEALFKVFDDKARGIPYAREFYDYRHKVPTEECRNFWDRIFVPFQAAILKAYDDDVQPGSEFGGDFPRASEQP